MAIKYFSVCLCFIAQGGHNVYGKMFDVLLSNINPDR
jgi:hypothetical protein